MIELSWLLISMLYMFTAVYIKIKYSGLCTFKVPLAFFCIGAAIFIALNRRHGMFDDMIFDLLSALVSILLFMAWYFMFASTLYMIKWKKGEGPRSIFR